MPTDGSAAAFYAVLERLADRLEPDLKRVFLGAVKDLRSDLPSASRLVDALESERVLAVESAFPWDRLSAGMEGSVAPLKSMVLAAAEEVADQLSEQFRLVVNIDSVHARALAYAESHAAELVTAITEESRLAVRRVVADAFADEKRSFIQVARSLRGMVGLNTQQARSFDKFLQQVLAEADTTYSDLSAAQIQRLIDKEFRRLLKYRAETIAKTELWTAGNRAQQETWLEARDQGVMPDVYVQEWVTSPGFCPICGGLDGEVAEFGEVFVSRYDLSRYAGPIAHPRCRCNLRLRRRREEEE